MLYIIMEYTFSGYKEISLDILSFVAIFIGTLVIISKNPIMSILFLIGLFLSISTFLVITGYNFIGLSYLLVYIGAVSILFIFILMLINVRISELSIDSLNGVGLAILIGSFFNYFVNNILPYMILAFNSRLLRIITALRLAHVTSPSWEGYLAETSHITSIGNILYANYSIWLIITSIILLLAMVGCIVITLKEKTSELGENEVNPHGSTSLSLQSTMVGGSVKSKRGIHTLTKVFNSSTIWGKDNYIIKYELYKGKINIDIRRPCVAMRSFSSLPYDSRDLHINSTYYNIHFDDRRAVLLFPSVTSPYVEFKHKLKWWII